MMMMMMCSAADNIVKADDVRTLVKDIWDVRMAKLRSSTHVFLKSDATHAKVSCHLGNGQRLPLVQTPR